MKVNLVSKGERKGIVFNPENKSQMTYGEVFDPIMKIENDDEMREYYHKYIEWVAQNENMSIDQAQKICSHNIGYLLGYCSIDTRMRIERVLDIEHPLFGKAKEKDWSSDELFQLGMSMAQREKMK